MNDYITNPNTTTGNYVFSEAFPQITITCGDLMVRSEYHRSTVKGTFQLARQIYFLITLEGDLVKIGAICFHTAEAAKTYDDDDGVPENHQYFTIIKGRLSEDRGYCECLFDIFQHKTELEKRSLQFLKNDYKAVQTW